MTVGPIAGAGAPVPAATTPETTEPVGAPDRDSDGDEAAAAIKPQAPAPKGLVDVRA